MEADADGVGRLVGKCGSDRVDRRFTHALRTEWPESITITAQSQFSVRGTSANAGMR